MLKHINNYSHIYIVIIVFSVLIYNLSYNYLHGNTIFLDDGIYRKSANIDNDMVFLSGMIQSGCENKDDVCKVQNILDYVTNIPYKVNKKQAHKPIDTIELNYGDCDDKSNLLISLIKSMKYNAYFVFIPKHAYVIVHIPNDYNNVLNDKKSFYIDGIKYYVLESTSKNSKIGNPIKHKLTDIEVILEPFTKTKVDINKVQYY